MGFRPVREREVAIWTTVSWFPATTILYVCGAASSQASAASSSASVPVSVRSPGWMRMSSSRRELSLAIVRVGDAHHAGPRGLDFLVDSESP